MQAGVVVMGELTFIKDGYATTIHDDGTTTTTVLDQCDECFNWEPQAGGLSITDVGRAAVIWICAKCRHK
jgi:GTPase